MYLLYLVGTIWSLLFLAFAMNSDTRRPMSTRLKNKYRVKDNSILRKIIKFKDKGSYFCNYFKIVPIYVLLLLLAIISLFLFFVDIIGNGVITNNINKKIFIIISVCIIVISIIYFLTIIIWLGLLIIMNSSSLKKK